MLAPRSLAVSAVVVLLSLLVGCTPDVKEERDRGVALFRQGQHYEAMATFRHALAQRPNDPESNYYMGLCYRNNAEQRLRDGDIAGANRQLDYAIRFFGQAIREWPNYTAAIDAQTEALEARGAYDQALARAEEITRQNRSIPEFHVYRGRQYAKRGDYDNAIVAFKTAIEMDPKCAEAYAELGRVYLKAGDTRLAASHLRKALQLNPKQPGVEADLERVYASSEGALVSDSGDN